MSFPHFFRRCVKPMTITGSVVATGTLSADFTTADITRVLGFPAETHCPYDSKVLTVSWSFNVEGRPCCIWMHHGRRWSVYDPCRIVPVLFGMKGGVS